MNKKTKVLFLILSYVIPILILLVVMYLRKIYPFGDHTVLLWDLEIQYIKPYNWLRDVLHGEASIFYSFSKSLGGNMYALASVYFLSPYNLLVYFFDAAHMAEFFSLISVLKIATCGLTAYIYLEKRFTIRNRSYTLLLSTAYALMEYNVSLVSNIHFIDAIYILPLLMLGVYYLIEKENKVLLFVSVACVIISNWYIGYMVCFFAVIYFCFELLWKYQTKEQIKECFNRIKVYVLTMGLGVMASAFVLLPGLLASMDGKGAISFEYLKPSFHVAPLYILRSLFITSEGNLNYNQPAIYVSALVLVLALMLYLDKRIEKRKKYLLFASSAFVFISFSFVPLEIIWTILKKTYSFHFRYAFVFSFLLIITAAFYLHELNRINESITLKGSMIASSILASYFILQNLIENFRSNKIVICFSGLMLVFGLLIYLYQRANQSVGRIMILIFICGCFFIEQTYNIGYTFSRYKISNQEYIQYNQNTGTVFNQIEAKEDTFYRMEQTFSELTKRRYPNVPSASEGFVFSYNGVTHYSSIYDSTVNDFLTYMGYSKLDAMATNYVDTNLVADSLIGLKYILTDKAPSIMKGEDSEKLSDHNKVFINESALGMGTVVDQKAANFKWDKNVFDNHVKFINELTGKNSAEQLYKKLTVLPIKKTKTADWKLKITASGPAYAYFTNDHSEAELYVNGEFKQIYFSRFYKNVFYLGEYEPGDTVTILLKDVEEESRDYGLVAVSVDTNVFQDIFQGLDKEHFEVTKVIGNKVSGKINCEEDSLLWLSIPYDEGWNVFVDGKRYTYKEILNGFIGLDLRKGNHTVELKFYPKYLNIALIVSVLGIAIFILWIMIAKRKKEGHQYDKF
jgi:uncharacterized membrane protein YfhO